MKRHKAFYFIKFMQLVETITIKKNHLFYKEIDELAFKSKNLYNASLYLIKQEYLKNKFTN